MTRAAFGFALVAGVLACSDASERGETPRAAEPTQKPAVEALQSEALPVIRLPELREGRLAGLLRSAVERLEAPLAPTLSTPRVKPQMLERIAKTADEQGRVRALVQLAPNADRGPLRSLLNDRQAKLKYEYEIVPGLVAVRRLPVEALEALLLTPGVVSIHEDRAVRGFLPQAIPLVEADPPALAAAGVPVTGNGVTVCVIDSGISAVDVQVDANRNHTCFPAGTVTASATFVTGTANALDDQGHGTFVAGIVGCRDAANPGVAPQANIAVAKVLNSEGSGNGSDVIAGIEWCANTVGADVLNLSLGGGFAMGDCDYDVEAQAINNATQGGAVVVVASSNDNRSNEVGIPSCASRALAVGSLYDADVGGVAFNEPDACTDATTSPNQVTCYSNKSPTLDLSAPGSVITSANYDGDPTPWSSGHGTSFAAPMVAGVVALMREWEPGHSPEDIRQILWGHSDDFGGNAAPWPADGFDDNWGHGGVNAVRALSEPAQRVCALAADCDDGDPCTAERCVGGACERLPSCDDFDACSDDTCNAGACSNVGAPAPPAELCGVASACDACTGVTYTPVANGTCNDVCAAAIPLRVGQTISGDTTGASNDYDPIATGSRCAQGYAQPGPDLVYSVTLKATEQVRITLDPTVEDLSVYVLGGDCDDSRCYAGVDGFTQGGAETVGAFTAPVDGLYYVVVDSWNAGVVSPFTLSITPVCYADQDGKPCDDHDACTYGDVCSGGVCAGGAPPACTEDADCDDGNACTTDNCDVGSGVCSNTAPDCSGAGDQCNTASCDPGGSPGNCAVLSPTNEGQSCNDGAACAVGETCQAGACAGGAAPDCGGAGDQCKTASCDPGGAEGNCDTLAAVVDGTGCDDGDACNAGEACQAGVCSGGAAPDCSGAGDQCASAACDPGGAEGNCGALSPINEGQGCDDGSVCTVGEVCTGGSCVGGGGPDCSGAGDQCNVASCDPGGAAGNCDSLTPVGNGTACDDGAACNVGEACVAGQCVGGAAADCSGVGDACNAASCDPGGAEGNCNSVAQEPDGTDCDNGDACAPDQCLAGVCQEQACDVGPKLAYTLVSGASDAALISVQVAKSYTQMVVVCTVNATDGPSAVPRVSNVGASSFDLRLGMASAGNAAGLDVHCLSAEAGVYTVAEHGIKMEAATYLSTVTDRKNSWVGQARAYTNSYTSPVVVGQVMSTNDASWSVFWAHNGSRTGPPTAAQLFLGKHVGEDPDTTRADETVGYMVFEAGSGSVGTLDYTAGVGADTARGMTNGAPFAYAVAGLSAEGAVLSSAAMDGGDGGWPILYGADPVSANSLALAINEDTLGDGERSHTTEQVAYVAVEVTAECAVDGDCDDGNACTDNTCDAGTCVAANNVDPCDDGDACTVGEVCGGGACGGGAAPDCSGAGDQCNSAACDPGGADGNCDVATPLVDGTTCDDGSACNVGEVCTAGACGGGAAPDCSGAGDQCNSAA